MATETGEETDDASPETPSTETDDSSTDTATPSAETDTETDGTAEEPTEGLGQHMRAVVVTTGSTLFGVFAAVLSVLLATEGGDPDNLLGFGILMATVLVQFPLYRIIGIDPDELEIKDQVYIFAMTFVMWFIIWTIFLTTGALQ